jgi:ligand-binding sensor domain-containing protein
MTKSPLLKLMGILMVAWVFIPPDYGQTKTSPKPIPVILGSPPPLVGKPGPINDPTLVSQYIRSIFQDSKGNYWFGPLGHGVIRYDIVTLRYYSNREFFNNNSILQDNSTSIHATAEDKQGNIWFGTDRGVVQYDGKVFRSYTQEHGLTNTNVGRKCILVDKAGTVWVGTMGGIFRYDPVADYKGTKCFSRFGLLPAIKATDILEDKFGNIWFASASHGVFRYDGKTIKNITAKEDLGDNYAGGMALDPAGNLWFLMKHGICRYDVRLAEGKAFTEITAHDGLG